MKGVLISALLVGAVAATMSPMITAIYHDAYPQDPGKRQALDQCYQADHAFNRLLASERAACYERLAPPSLPVARAGAGYAAANFVDLWQAQSRGHQPMDDVRTQQRNAASLRSIRASAD
jgi:hypothetical protein